MKSKTTKIHSRKNYYPQILRASESSTCRYEVFPFKLLIHPRHLIESRLRPCFYHERFVTCLSQYFPDSHAYNVYCLDSKSLTVPASCEKIIKLKLMTLVMTSFFHVYLHKIINTHKMLMLSLTRSHQVMLCLGSNVISSFTTSNNVSLFIISIKHK